MLSRKIRAVEPAAPPSDLSLAGASMTYRNLVARRDALRKRRDELLADQRNLWETEPSTRFSMAGKPAEARERHESVADLLPAATTSNSVGAYLAVVGERQDVEAALEVLDQKIHRERLVASRLVVAAVKPHHDELARKLAAAMLAAAEVAADYCQLIEDLSNEGVAFASLDCVPVSRMGDPRRFDSKWNDYLRGVIKAGYLAADAVPRHLSTSANPHTPLRAAR